MQNLDPSAGELAKESQPKQRHGCVTAWLVLMIVVYTATMFYSMISTNAELNPYAMVIPEWIYFTLSAVSLANVIFAIMLLKWRKVVFWGFAATSLITMGLNIYAGLGVTQSIVGLVGVGVLFAILQIKEDGRSAWENLE